MDYLIRALMAVVPVVALTMVGRQLGYRGLYLAAPGLLTVLFTIVWSLPLIQFVLGGAPVGVVGILKALVPSLKEAVWSAVSVTLVLLAVFGVKPAAGSPSGAAQ
ncbi:MAG: hypothetical protein Q7T19_00735 [Caulobacter sp.]|nr:hypothetical protein [Caulobacter sp.]